MNKSTFNLLVIITSILYITFGIVYVIKPKKVETKIPEISIGVPDKPIDNTTPIDKVNSLDINNFAYYIKDPNPTVINNSPFDLVITDYEPFKKDQIDRMKLKQNSSSIDLVIGDNQTIKKDQVKTKQTKSRRIILSYVSLGMAENYRDYWKKEWNKTPPNFIGRESNLWKGNYIIKNIDSPDWWNLTTYMLDSIIDKNFDGILIGGIDSYLSDNNLESRKKMIDYVIKVSNYVKKKNKNFIVLVQNSEELTNDDSYTKSIDGLLKEDLVYTWKANGNTGPKTPVTELNKSLEYLRTFRLKNKLVLVVEYVSEDSWKYAEQIIDKNGFIGYSAPRELNVLRIQ